MVILVLDKTKHRSSIAMEESPLELDAPVVELDGGPSLDRLGILLRGGCNLSRVSAMVVAHMERISTLDRSRNPGR